MSSFQAKKPFYHTIAILNATAALIGIESRTRDRDVQQQFAQHEGL